MKRFLSVLFIALSAGLLMAQEPAHDRPQRTPEEEALKQTTMLVRELGITDSVRIDSLYAMHLRYARARHQNITRAQDMERMQAIYESLKRLLTAEEFERFMNHPVEQPRRPRGAHMISPNRQVPPKEPQLKDPQ